MIPMDEQTERIMQNHIVAVADLVGHMGATSFQMRYCDEEQPVLWMSIAEFVDKDRGILYIVGASTAPDVAGLDLVQKLVRNAQCTHCGREARLSLDWSADLPLNTPDICWYLYDGEQAKFQRSCTVFGIT